MKKFLIVAISLVFIFCLSLAVNATCFEDYEIAKLEQIAKKTITYNPGGYNKDNGEIDGNLNSGVAPDWRGGDGISITYDYNKTHLVRAITITFEYDIGRGFDLEVSSDGGITWTVVANVMPVEGDTVGKQTIAYPVNNGNGAEINAFKFTYRGTVVQYNLSLYEISITASNTLECAWNEGDVKIVGNCGVDGEILYTCTKCNDTKTEIVPATGEHGWDDGVEIVAPTESSNGQLKYTCSVCSMTKTEDVPAIGHNWDAGIVVPPTCTEKGYTRYTCTDVGCGKSYDAYFVNEIGHSYDDGVETKHPSLTAEGVLTFSCVRDGCDEFYTQALPKATYDDSKFVIGLDNVISMIEELKNADKASDKRDPNGVLDGNITNGGQSDDSAAGSWFAPSGSSLTITLDEEYYILSAKLFVWSNWNQLTIDFIDAQGNVVLAFSDGKCQNTDGSAVEIANINSALVKSIKITSVGAKGDSGNCLAIHELQLVAHKHLAEGETERYDEVTDCVEGGSYKKYCYVCEKEVVVETKATGEHSFVNSIEYENGYDKVGKIIHSCENCSASNTSRTQSIFYSYGYSVREFGEVCISHKVEVNLEALEIYNSYASSPLNFGMVAASTLNFETVPLEIKDGAIAKTSDKVIVKDFSSSDYTCFEYTISNIPEFAYDTDVVLCPFVFDGKSLSYININSDSGSAYEVVSFNSLTK